MRLHRFVPISLVLVLACLAPAPAAGDSHMAVTGADGAIATAEVFLK